MHLVSVINQVVTTNTSLTVVLANAGAFLLTGTAATTVATGLSNKEQENTVGNRINTIIINCAFRQAVSAAIVSYTIMKIERANVVPAPGAGLPADAAVLTNGMQQQDRLFQPGRIIKYGTVAIAPEQPVSISLKADFAKYKMGKIRQGDFYLIRFFNRSGDTLIIDVEARYLASQ